MYRLDLRGKAFANILQTVSGGKKTLEFPTKKAAETKADEIDALLAHYGSKKLEMLESAMRVDPVQLQQRLDPFGKTILEAVDFYVSYLSQERESLRTQTLAVLMDEWIAEKAKRVEQGSLRKTTYDTLYYKANGEGGYKAQWGNRPVATITQKEVKDWIESRMVKLGTKDNPSLKYASQVSKQHQLSYLSQFFIWCKKTYGVPRDNPCGFVTVNIDEAAGEVQYFTPEEAQQILNHSITKRFLSLLPFHSICMFSGIRTAECERLTWENIDFEDKTIKLSKLNSKTAGRRTKMQPNLVAWLTWFHLTYPNYPLIPAVGFGDKKRQFRKTVGLCWHKNGMRHSAASYTLGAKLGDYGFLESNFGNSRTMLEKHYLNYPSEKVSLQFWAIVPPV